MTSAELALLGKNVFANTLIDGVSREHQVFARFNALPLKGTQYDSMVIAGDPTASRFLRRGEGYTAGRRTFAKGKVNAARLGFMIDEPVSVTDEWNRAAAEAGISGLDWLTQCAMGQFETHLAYVENQLFLGTANDVLGFLGLKEICSYVSGNVLALTDRPEASGYVKSVMNAAGSTANTADSVYSVNMGDRACTLRIGGEQGIQGFLKMSPVVKEYQADAADATRQQQNYKSHCEGYIGLEVMGSSEAYADRAYSQFDVRRLANLTVAVPLTEAMLDSLIESHPDGHMPNILFMSKRAQTQLRTSRAGSTPAVSINMGAGEARNAQYTLTLPLPDNHRGIPIVATRRIASTQAIET